MEFSHLSDYHVMFQDSKVIITPPQFGFFKEKQAGNLTVPEFSQEMKLRAW